MEHVTPANPVLAFRFGASFSHVDGEHEKLLNHISQLGFNSIGVSSRGFEVWRALFYNEPSIFGLIGEANQVECVTWGRSVGKVIRVGEGAKVDAKVFCFQLADPIHLPMAIDPNITSSATSPGLDANKSNVVMEGIVWRRWWLVSVKDEQRVFPPPAPA